MGILKTGYKAAKFIAPYAIPGYRQMTKYFGYDPQSFKNTFGAKGKDARKKTKKGWNAFIFGEKGGQGIGVNLKTGNVKGAAKNIKALITQNDDSWFRLHGETEESSKPLTIFNSPIVKDDSFVPSASGVSTIAPYSPYKTPISIFVHKEQLYSGGTLEGSVWNESLSKLYRKLYQSLGFAPSYTYAEFAVAIDKSIELYTIYASLIKMYGLSQSSDPQNPSANLLPNEAVPADWGDSYRAQCLGRINRARDFIRDSIRLPKSLSSYIEWRYGHIYKTLDNRASAYVVYNHDNTTSASLVSVINELIASNVSLNVLADMVKLIPNSPKLDWDPQLRYDLKEVQMRENLSNKYIFEGKTKVTMSQGLHHVEALRAALLAARVDDATLGSVAPFHVTSIIAYVPDGTGGLDALSFNDDVSYTNTTTLESVKNTIGLTAAVLASGYTGVERAFNNTDTGAQVILSGTGGDFRYMLSNEISVIQQEAMSALLDL